MRITAAVTLTVAVCLCASGQTQLDTFREIKLPVPGGRGSFGGSLSGFPAPKLFSIKVTPDQSLLVFDSNANGQWSLIRLMKWWTKHPVSEVMNIPNWTASDTKHLGQIFVDLQITQDGRYAVAFAGANWSEKSDGPWFLFPAHYTAHKPDTILTVIDLETWNIVGSIHTARLVDADFRGARILSGNSIALQGLFPRPRPRDEIYDRVNSLISIPDLKLGPGCVSKRPLESRSDEGKRSAEALNRQNDAACADLLQASGAPSIKALETIIHTGHGLEPEVLGPTKDFDEHWTLYRWFSGPMLIESSSHTWYALDRLGLSSFDAAGQVLKSQANSICAGKAHSGRNQRCSCRLENVSEEQHILLTSCWILRERILDSKSVIRWLSVFRSDDLSEVGSANLSANEETHQTLAIVDGRAYALAVERGEMLRILAIAAQH